MAKSKLLFKDPETVGPKKESLIIRAELQPKQASFLNKIANIESSSGQDTDHPEVDDGIQAGDHAVGKYGIMPNTVMEFTKRIIKNGDAPPVVRQIATVQNPQDAANQVAADPDLEQLYAKNIQQHLDQNQNGDEDKEAYSWNQGHNLGSDDISQEDLDASPYVQKFRKLQGIIK